MSYTKTLTYHKDNVNSKKFIPTYDVGKDYYYNFEHGPFFSQDLKLPERIIKGKEVFLGFHVNSRFGVPAGPLLNSKWIKLYAELGFDILTYKTVRSHENKAHPFPNCLFLDIKRQIKESEISLPLYAFDINHSPETYQELTITNSFGVPSHNPNIWQANVNSAKDYLNEGQILILSVMGTPDEDGDWRSIISDYVKCAKLAEETNADIIELNLSCPNVLHKEGSIFMDHELTRLICERVKKECKKPILLKIGFLHEINKIKFLMDAAAPFVDGIVAINTLRMRILNKDGLPALGSNRESSGVCGAAIKDCAKSQVARMLEIKNAYKYNMAIIGVGGVIIPKDIEEYLSLGVDAVQSATGAMWNPLLAYNYFEEKFRSTKL